MSPFSSMPTPATLPLSLLTSLLAQITTATYTLQCELDAAGLPEPWIDQAALHPWDEETPSMRYWDARKTLVSALGMMIAIVQNPRERLMCEGMSYHQPAALHFIAKTHIADILAASDVDESVGLPVTEIARRAETHPAKTERILRFLCVNHIFQETGPCIFANNRISACPRTGNPNAEVPIFWSDIAFRSATAFSRNMRDPRTARSMRTEDAAFSVVFGGKGEYLPPRTVPISWDESTVNARHKGSGTDVKMSERTLEVSSRPVNGKPNGDLHKLNGDTSPTITSGPVISIQRDNAEEFIVETSTDAPNVTGKSKSTTRVSGVLGENKLRVDAPQCAPTVFHFLAHPSNAHYRSAFAQGMRMLEIMNGALGFRDFQWERWDKEGGVFVDIGASTGHLAHAILPLLKHVRIVNQDRPEVCLEGEKFFTTNNPAAITSGRVTFQPNDFFTGQPVQGAAIYILSNILHDWPDEEAQTILRHMADAMTSASRLLVIEIVIVPALSQSRSRPPSEGEQDSKHAPWPLMTDYGVANRYAHHQSMELINLLNGLDRTLNEYIALFEQTGLELVQVHSIRKLVSVMEARKKEHITKSNLRA